MSENRRRKLRSESSFSFLSSNSSIRCCPPTPRTFDTGSTPTPVDSMPWIFMFLFLSACWILWIHSLGISASKGSSSSSFPISTSARDSQLVRCHHQLVLHFDQSFRWTTSALLCRLRFPTADSSLQDNDQHRLHVGLCRFHFSVQVGKKCCYRDGLERVRSFHTYSPNFQNEFSFPDQFCCEENHVSTVVSKIEILTFVTLELPRSTVKNALTSGRSIKSSTSHHHTKSCPCEYCQ